MLTTDRRSFLLGAGALGVCLGLPGVSMAGGTGDRRLVVVLCRGGMDGLAALPAHGDPHYRAARGDMALPAPGADGGIVDLDGTFGLHPALAPLHAAWEAGELLPVHATCIPYRERSHFDAQDILENGTDTAFGADTGWLGRALAHTPEGPAAMALGRSVPLVLRGPAAATSADPTRPARHDDPALERIADLYDGDPWLGPALAQALETQALLARHRPGSLGARRGGAPDPSRAAAIAGRLAATDEGPRTLVLEVGGWDSHANQEPVLRRQLTGLAAAYEALAEAMAPVWDRTVVVVATEFGRAVHANGTGGTDHGTGGVAVLAGGAVRGGRVHTDWPGLRDADLLDGRDLRPTTDLRAVLKGVLRDHLGLDRRVLDREVFPGSGDVRPLDGLIA